MRSAAPREKTAGNHEWTKITAEMAILQALARVSGFFSTEEPF